LWHTRAKLICSEVTYATPVERDIAAPQEEIMSGLTTIFGYLLAGLTDNEMELLKACVAVSSLADSKWARIGLIPTALQGSLPAPLLAPRALPR